MGTNDPGLRVVHSLPGRARVYLPGLRGANQRTLERQLCELQGVRGARVSAQTGNVLVHFDHDATDEAAIVSELGRLAQAPAVAEPSAAAEPARQERRRPVLRRSGRRARVAVRGLDRDPELGAKIVERLERRPEVERVTVSVLTGRILIELAEEFAGLDEFAGLEELLAEIAELEPPVEDGEHTPSHPLDPGPVIQESARAIGSVLGLSLLALRRARGSTGAPVGSATPAQLAGVLGIIEGLPPVVDRIEGALGHDGKELVLGGIGIASLTFSGSALGLAMAGALSVRLLTETRARREAWRDYERRLSFERPAHPGARLRIEAGERLPLRARAVEGYGTAIGADGMPRPVTPGGRLDAGDKVYGGPFVVELEGGGAFAAERDRPPPKGSAADRYLALIGPVSLAYAGLTGVLTRSLGRAFTALLLVNPRAALVGKDAADHGASARVMRSGATVVGSRPGHSIRRPDALLLSSPRVLTDGLEVGAVVARAEGVAEPDVIRTAASVAGAAGSPWAGTLGVGGRVEASEGNFDGATATATIDGERWSLTASSGTGDGTADAAETTLELRRGDDQVGEVTLRPRLAPGATELAAVCKRYGVRLVVLTPERSPAALAIAGRVDALVQTKPEPQDAAEEVRALRRQRKFVAVVSDSADAAQAFAASDLAIGLTSGRSGRFLARADILAPGLDAVAAVIEAGARRDAAVKDAVFCSLLANIAGGAWGLSRAPRFDRASRATQLGGLAAIAAGTVRLRGGRRARAVTERLSDPQPERWGRESVETVLRVLESSPRGLTVAQAGERRPAVVVEHMKKNPLASAVTEQLKSPLTGFLIAGGALSLSLGVVGDVVMIAAVIVANATVSAWQEHQSDQAAEALEQMSARRATVLRDARELELPAGELVVGDVIVLSPGVRVAADARLIEADRLEVDEAALTGESLPVPKTINNGTDSSRIVLEGTDVTVGTGKAMVVAVGRDTRMGAVSAALSADYPEESPLDQRLTRILRIGLPVILLGGAAVTVSGLLRSQPLVPQLALGTSIAIAAVPEGLPLLAGVAQAGVARRLADRKATLHRLSSVEALGRVDVACADKTGTLTEGRLAVTHVGDPSGRTESLSSLSAAFGEILLAAALASPHPDAADAESHPTDVAVVDAAERAGLQGPLRNRREAESPFDPDQSFHATLTADRLWLKGAAEVLVDRCARVQVTGDSGGNNGDVTSEPLDDAGRQQLLGRANDLAERGLRVLMVAEGPRDTSPDDPRDLTALGFVGISDPLRPTVRAAVERCHEAGVRVIMLTGDHPATAQAIAREAGLSNGDGSNGDRSLLTGADIVGLDDRDLDERLEHANVVARITPLDKVRIVEALQRRGHVVAMTGDGVNDAPALRLADVGVAMGHGGTEVARQAAEVVLTDDDFSTLVEAMVEGRAFWRNIRRALGLLLGGNLGELGLMVSATAVGLPSPLTTRQVLTVNLVTDVLPAVAVAVQAPEDRNLAGLAREGVGGMDQRLKGDVLRRGTATALPSLAAYIAASRMMPGPPAQAVAFASIVGTQLAQTIDLGRAEGRLTRSVAGAVLGSIFMVALSMTAPPLQRFLGLSAPNPLGLLLIAGASASAVAVSRALAGGRSLQLEPAVAPRQLEPALA